MRIPRRQTGLVIPQYPRATSRHAISSCDRNLVSREEEDLL